MNIDIDFKVKCYDCENTYNEETEDGYYQCEECFNKNIINHFKEAMIAAAESDYIWKDKDGYIGFDTEKEKEIFMKGIRYGFFNALFKISTYWNDELVSFWENLDEKSRITQDLDGNNKLILKE